MRFFNFGESLNQKTLRGKKKESAPNMLTPYGIHCQTILRNASPAILYEEALLYETDSAVSNTGALIVSFSEKQDFYSINTPFNIDIDTEDDWELVKRMTSLHKYAKMIYTHLIGKRFLPPPIKPLM